MEGEGIIRSDRENQLLGGALTWQALTLRRYTKVLIRYTWSRFDETKETEYLNHAIQQLQEQGATIIDIKTSVSQPMVGATIVIYTVIYDLTTICR